jgi:hypothetical protein
VAWAVEAVAADLGADYGVAVVVDDLGHLEANASADELAVAPATDLVAAAELAAPVVDDTIDGEAVEEGLGVVGVGRSECGGDRLGDLVVFGISVKETTRSAASPVACPPRRSA